MTLLDDLRAALARNEGKGDAGLAIVLLGPRPRVTGWPRGEALGPAPSGGSARGYTVAETRRAIAALEKETTP